MAALGYTPTMQDALLVARERSDGWRQLPRGKAVAAAFKLAHTLTKLLL
jgi:hypothetical protein